MSTVEYVSDDDTIAEVAIRVQTSASLRTSTAIILTAMLTASYLLNGILLVTVLFYRKLRARLLYLFFCHLAALNILTLTFTVLFALIYVANGDWLMGMGACRMTAMMQQFTQIYTFFSLILMAVERTITIASSPNQPLFTPLRCLIFHGALIAIALAITLPIVTPAIPVKQFAFRYLCAIGSGSPIAFTATSLLLFIGCLLVFLICAGAILARKQNKRNLPVRPADYSAFIQLTRQTQEDVSHGKLVLLLIAIFIVLCAPYAILCFYYQIRNSAELLRSMVVMEMAADADTLITWISFLFPLFAPITIFCWVPDIWPDVKEILCCKSTELPTLTYYTGTKGPLTSANVMTLVATADGLQLKMAPAPMKPAFKVPVLAPQQMILPQVPEPTAVMRMTEPTEKVRFSPPLVRIHRTTERMIVHPPNYIPSEEEDDDLFDYKPRKTPPKKSHIPKTKSTTTSKSTSLSSNSSGSKPAAKPLTRRPRAVRDGSEPSSLMKPAPKRRAAPPRAPGGVKRMSRPL
ncbi:hypothetical protein PENTCL1PPCAC_28154 [Pristionchus entomophagus]|uniref:G-protein coupled receptors family 1 profile domain-containing protein n=1 Tax=Pristionchus entomophagus TaxID=358040 RepID=A0AAV5UI99_9BILA|nr:hypothetical protein PENTCL1PPCAC_28154 [Pristionchus entomophagus]